MNAPIPLPIPLAMLAELTHRCPLQCPYCSNPIELEQARGELSTTEWRRVLDEAAAMGVLQVHFSGGEPLVRRDLAMLVRHARDAGLYTNLITSGLPLSGERMRELKDAGLDHVQISIQDSDEQEGDRIGGAQGAQRRKRAAAQRVVDAGLPLTVNAVVHRRNLDRLGEMIELALALGAQRLEVAHVQYYGWALRNRDALMPTRTQVESAGMVVEAARRRLRDRMQIDYVPPDYHARYPKPCMSGWGQRFLNVSPSGKVLPCHAAETFTDMRFDNVRERALADIWASSPAFERFRGTGWMPEPCRSCARREIDWGGCRCQALAMTGDGRNADPACHLSRHHAAFTAVAEQASARPAEALHYRRLPSAAKTGAGP